MEALETAVAYWEDAIRAYGHGGKKGNSKTITTKEESEFCKALQELLENVYQLQV